MIAKLIIALLGRLDDLGLLDVAKAIVARRLNSLLVPHIDRLIRWVDDMDLPGEEKMQKVIGLLTEPNTPHGQIAQNMPLSAIRWAIETVYQRIKAEA